MVTAMWLFGALLRTGLIAVVSVSIDILPEVPRSLALLMMRAITTCCSPSDLQRHQYQQEDGDQSTHRRNCSNYSLMVKRVSATAYSFVREKEKAVAETLFT